MLNLLNYMRIGKFEHHVYLQKYQRHLCDYFLRYTVSESEIKNQQRKGFKAGMPLETQLNSCNPEVSDIDKLIFREITGKKYCDDDNEDERSRTSQVTTNEQKYSAPNLEQNL